MTKAPPCQLTRTSGRPREGRRNFLELRGGEVPRIVFPRTTLNKGKKKGRSCEPKGKPFDHPWAEDGPYWNLNGGLLSTAHDMFRWHAALRGDQVLSKSAKDKLCKPHVPEEEGGDSYYGYGWVVAPTDGGRVVWHDGGNGRSLGVVARFLDQGAMVFWVSNHAYKDGEWNLEKQQRELTLGIAERVLEDG